MGIPSFILIYFSISDIESFVKSFFECEHCSRQSWVGLHGEIYLSLSGRIENCGVKRLIARKNFALRCCLEQITSSVYRYEMLYLFSLGLAPTLNPLEQFASGILGRAFDIVPDKIGSSILSNQ